MNAYINEYINEDKAADEIDMASNVAMINDAEAMARQFEKRYRSLPANFDGENCFECGEAINPKRIEAMKYTIEASKNVYPHHTDVISKDKRSVTKHGTELCIDCANIKDICSRQFS